MLIRGRPGAGGLRGTLIAVAVITLAIGCSWLMPGLAWRGLAAMERPAALQQPDSVQAADSIRAADSVRAAVQAPPTVPGAQIQLDGPSGPRGPESPWTRFSGIFGLVLIIGIGVALSHNRRAIRWRVIAWGLGLQVLFAIFVLRIPAGQALFRWLGDLVSGILGYSYIGSQFVFGELGKPNSSLGVIFAFQLLPAIIFVSALFAILYYLGHHAAHRPRVRHPDEPGDGRERRGEPQRRGVDLHGTDRGAARRSARSCPG